MYAEMMMVEAREGIEEGIKVGSVTNRVFGSTALFGRPI